jgi:apolipoprotein N-acyltransferase
LFSLYILVSNISLWIIRATDTNSPTVSTSVLNTNFPSGTTYTIEDRDFVTSIAPNGASDLSDIVISPEGFQLDVLFKAPSPDSKQLFIGTTASSSGQILYFNEFENQKKYYTSKNILMPIGDYRLWWTDLLLKQTQTEKWFSGYIKRYEVKKNLPHNLYHDSDSPLVIVGTVCSDNISPYIYRNATNQGANLLVNIASHAPFRGSALLSRQTISINTTRALETGRYFVTSANFDKSTVIDDRGKIIYSSTGEDLVSFKTVKAKLKTYTTPYTKFGNYILYLSLLLLVFFWRRQTKNK